MSALIVACFVLSGATSLILQVVWVRKLTEVFGSSTLAISTVLATFMAGLALGAWIGGRFADRLRNAGGGRRGLFRAPLFYYAACEAVVAVAALIIPELIELYRPLNAALWAQLGGSPTLLALSRFALTAVVLLIPTTAMGATLPLLGRQVTQSPSDFGVLSTRLGTLYAANTAGAVLGAGSAGFILLPALGASATNALAAFLAGSLAAAIVLALVISRSKDRPSLEPQTSEQDDTDANTGDLGLSARQRRIALFVYGLSGATAMALEVLWSRALAIVIGSSVYSFTLILVVFLIGISSGSASFARIARRVRDPMGALAIVLGVTGLCVALTHFVIDDLPALFLSMIESGSFEPRSIIIIHSVLVGLVILPGAFGLGAIMPLAMRAYVGSIGAVGRDVGRAYAANTVGAIFGSILGGVALLPLVGIERGVQACAISYSICVAVIYIAKTAERRRGAMGLAVATVALVILSPSWNKSDFTVGLFRSHLARHYQESGLADRDVVYYADGIATTVTVERFDDRWTLRNNGKTEASNRADMPTQILVGLLPVIVRQSAEQHVFVIGYGSGVTIGAITQSPDVKRVDVVELEPRVLEAADKYFAPFNNRAHEDPKVHRHIGDGRDVLLAGGLKYDVIVSEPSNPWMAGVSSLFTREFYRFAKGHLAEDGIFCQWAQLYELGPRNVKMIYATFAEAFPYVYAFTPGDAAGDTILIGAMKPIVLDTDDLEKRIARSPLAEELERADVRRIETIIASFFLGPGEIASFTAGADINTDDNAALEFRAPLDLMSEKRARLTREFRSSGWPYGRLAGMVNLGERPGPRAAALSQALVSFGRYREASHWLEVARNHGGSPEVEATTQLIELAKPVAPNDPELVITLDGPPLAPPTIALFDASDHEARKGLEGLQTAYSYLAEGNWPSAWRAVEDLPEPSASDEGDDLRLLQGYLAYKTLKLRTARRILKKLGSDRLFLRRPAARYYLARVLLGLGNFDDGTEHMLKFIAAHPKLAQQAIDSRL